MTELQQLSRRLQAELLNRPDRSREALLYGGIALGLLAGAALSTYIWRQRVQSALEEPPLERAEQIIDACEAKLDRIEQLMNELQEKNR